MDGPNGRAGRAVATPSRLGEGKGVWGCRLGTGAAKSKGREGISEGRDRE